MNPRPALHWLDTAAAGYTDPQPMFDAFCQALRAGGLELWRATLGLETLHPETSGTSLTWLDGTMHTSESARAGIVASPGYLNSPTRIVDETERNFRRRLNRPVANLPMLDELRLQGATDYCMFALPFLERTRTAVLSVATRAPGGFDARTLRQVERLVRRFSPYAERMLLRQIAGNLLAAYLGNSAGQAVYAGRIERGDVQTITAAIWFCDLRGFTALSEALPRRATVALLNRWFDAIGCAFTEAGGEILKFMGDGMLGVFPVGESAEVTCRRALAAARHALANHQDLNAELAAAGEQTLDFGLALHLGDVEFGNVGADTRLDFTVIGPAVNHASRLQALTKELGRQVVVSHAFAAAVAVNLRSLGMFTLRGVSDPVEVFGI